MATRSFPIEYIRDLVCDAGDNNRPRIIILVLSRAYPGPLTAFELMKAMGLPWREQPILSFVSLCINFKNVNRGLRCYGWQAVRDVPTPVGNYWLSPLGGG